MDTLKEARTKAEGVLASLLKTVRLPVERAAGHVLAADVCAPLDVPGFWRSTVDGFAVRAADTAGAGEGIPAFLTQAGESFMGTAADYALGPGQCGAVPTGGMLPQGADAVVMKEYCEPAPGGQVAVYAAVGVGEGTVSPGEDMRAGDCILRRGTRLTAGHLGALAAAGVSAVAVYEPLEAAVFSTGDELALPGEPLPPGHVYDVNTPALCALAAELGFRVKRRAVLPDQRAAMLAAVGEALADCDIVCLSGGSSQGKKDMTASVLGALAAPGVLTHGLALKPGKPTILAHDEESRTLLVGLPGHPAAAMTVFRLLVAGAAAASMGCPAPLTVPARMASNLACEGGRVNCIPVELRRDGAGYAATPVRGKSGLITTLVRANGYVLTARGAEGLKEGEAVDVYLY